MKRCPANGGSVCIAGRSFVRAALGLLMQQPVDLLDEKLRRDGANLLVSHDASWACSHDR